MFVLCWTNSKESNWEILSTKEEIKERVIDLIQNNDCLSEDMVIFRDDDYLVPDEKGNL